MFRSVRNLIKNIIEVIPMLKIGLIGAGMMGQVHAEAYAQVQGARLVGIADVNLETAQTAAGKAGVNFYNNLEELAAKENPDIIDICLPTHLHKTYVIKAAKLGKHIFCEKPIAGTSEEADSMIDACQKAGVRLMIGHVLRFFPDYVKAKQMVEANKIGKVGTVRMKRESSMPTGSQNWYQNFALSGGVILDLIIHDLDWLRWTFGDVERVYAKSLIAKEGASVDLAFLSLRMKNGIIAHVSGSWAQPEGFSTFLELAGQTGVMTMEYDDTSMPIRSITREESGIARNAECPFGISPYALELQHFVNCIQHNKQHDITGQEALKSLKVSLAALESARTGRVITL
jgi:UDP-N-acetylglucosamine 3-dehydrogenase